jgi:hypothetical protein
MRFNSCGSSKGFKKSTYQEALRISSHYSMIILAIGFCSKEGSGWPTKPDNAKYYIYPKYQSQPLSQKN